MVRLAAIFAAFVPAFAALRPAFLSREPVAFPVLGTSIFYSLAEGMESLYFTASFVAFVAIVLVLDVLGVLRIAPAARPSLPAQEPRPHGRLVLALGMLLPGVVLLLPLPPPVFVADTLHHGEKLIFMGRPLDEAYKSFLPFKPLLFLKAAGLFGIEHGVASYLAVREIVQRLGFIAACCLLTLVVRLMRGRWSLAPALLFLLAFPALTAALRHRYWILDMERLLFFLLFLNAVLLSLVGGRRWPLAFAGTFVAAQFLASIEYALFAAVALAAHLLLLVLRDPRDGGQATALAAAGALPIAVALNAGGQLGPFVGFVAYTMHFPGLYGTPLLYTVADFGRAQAQVLVPIVGAWLALLWAAGVFVPRALLRRQLDDRSLWTYMVLLLAILMFKIGLGRSDVQHLYIPLVFAGLLLLTLGLARPFPWPRVPGKALAALLAAAVAWVAIAGWRTPGVPPGYVYDPSPRVRAHVPPWLSRDLDAIRQLLAGTGSRSIFFFSDQPLYNYLLDLPYGLRNPTLHEILTDDMLSRETGAFLAWSPDLVVWRAESWTGFIDRIRTPVRDYRLAAMILSRYQPLAERNGWLVLARDAGRIDRAALAAKGFRPIDHAALWETFQWRDMAYQIGRARIIPPDFRVVTLSMPEDRCCAYRQDGRALLYFRGKAGTHRYALYPSMAPGYRGAAWSPDSITCTACDDALRAPMIR
jgi:hypothetical protein